MKAKIKNEQGEVLKAGGVICNDIGEILLVQIPGQPFWSFPKGHVEGIESDEEAALRELREETGYKVHIITQLPDVCYENKQTHEPIRIKMYQCYPLVKYDDGEEGVSKEWFSVDGARTHLAENLRFVCDHIKLTRNPINILSDDYQALSPFSPHPISIWGLTFPTLEHAYQWSKLRDINQAAAQEILEASTPLIAWEIAQKYKTSSETGIDKAAIMEELMRAKVAQHSDVADTLQNTGNREIIKVLPDDAYWGTGRDGKGANVMGKLWMKLRDEFK